MSSFFDNFMGGLAFGMLASNPFFRGMGGFGCGCGYGGVGGFIFGGMYNAVSLTGFANPFPSIFGGYMGGGYASSSGLIMPTSFANPSFPNIDFQAPCQTIWDTFTNPDSNYNKSMRDWYEKMTNNKSSETNTNKSENKNKTSAATSSNTISKSNGNNKREFENIYNSLGIKDKRFQKIFEECILNSEGREYTFDVHAMANSGVQQGTYDDYRNSKGLAKRDVKYMTETEMCELYYNIYKDCGADKIKNDKMALYVFDVAVNSGSEKAKDLYQKSGDNPTEFENLRIDFYKYLAKKDPDKYGKYLNSWLNRVKKTREYADNNLSAVA